MIARVASGVTSVGANPVPPVLSTSSQRSTSDQCRRRSSILPRSSAISSRPAISAPKPSASRARRGPPRSSPLPAARELLTVMIAARMRRSARARAVVAPPLPATTAALLQQRQPLHLDPPLDALDHVIHGQGRDRASGHRLHLHPGASHRSDLRDQLHEAVVG